MVFPRTFFNAIVYRGELIPVGYNTDYTSHSDWVLRHLELEPGWKAKLSDSEIPFGVYKKYPKLIRLTSDIGEGWLFVETGSLSHDLETLLLKYVTAFPKARFNIELSLADKNKIYKFPSSALLGGKLRDLVRDPSLQVATASDELELLFNEIDSDYHFTFASYSVFQELFKGNPGFIQVISGSPEASDLAQAMGLSESNLEEYFEVLNKPVIDQAVYFINLSSSKPYGPSYMIVDSGPEQLVAEYLSSQDASLYKEIKGFLDHLGYAGSLGVKTFKYGKQIYSILGI